MKNIATQFREFFSAMGSKKNGQEIHSLENAGVSEKFNSLDSFIFLWKDCLKKMSVHTNDDISFSQYFTFGSDMNYIRKFVGKPVYAMGNHELNISILLYTVKIKGHNVNFELHFYDRKLFCINYTYNHLTSQERADIIQSLSEKYHVSSKDFKNSIIVDNYGNGLVIEEKGRLSINYLSPNSNVRYLAEAYPRYSKKAI